MALLKIESAEVTRHVGTRGAFAIAEHVTLPDGRTFPKTYTVWAEGTPPEIGSIVSVTGVFGAKVREYPVSNGAVAAPTMKHAVDVSINEPQVNILGSLPVDVEAPAEPATPTPAASQELPF